MSNMSKTGQTEQNIQPKKKKRFSRRRKVQLCIAVIVLFCFWWVWRQVSAPVRGHITTTNKPVTKQVKNAEKPLAASTVQSPYFQLSLPEGYRVQAGSQNVPGLLYQQTIIKPSAFGSVVVNIAVKVMPAGGLSGDTAYQLRTKAPARYSMSQQNINGENIVIASDADSAAIVAFWAHGGYLATISASSGIGNPADDDNATQKKVLQPVLAAWRWQ